MTRQTHSGGMFLTALLMAIAVTVLAAPVASAKPGQLDRSFGAGGKVTTAVNFGIGKHWSEAPAHLAQSPDGAIVISGHDVIARYLPNGRLDRGFGVNGVVTIGGVEGMLFFVSDLAVDRKGRVVVFGRAVDNSIIVRPVGQIVPASFSPSYATVVRFRPDGTLDTTFGGGDGIVRTDFGIHSSPSLEGIPVVDVTTGTVDRWNQPLLVVGTMQRDAPCVGHSSFLHRDKLIGRLTEVGELDLSFGGGDGTVPFQGVSQAPALALGDDKEIELAGFPDNQCRSGPSLALIRLAEDSGAPVEAFGTAGTRFYHQGRPRSIERIEVDRFGRTLVLARDALVRSKAKLVRFKANGNVDRSFGQRGEATVALPNDQSGLSDLAVDNRGRPLLVGSLKLGRGAGSCFRGDRCWITVIRLRTDGKPDRRFGRGGWVATRFGRRSRAIRGEGLVDRRGRLVVGGTVTRPDFEPPGALALARYRLGR